MLRLRLFELAFDLSCGWKTGGCGGRFLFRLAEALDTRPQRKPRPCTREKRIGSRHCRAGLTPDNAEIQLASVCGLVLVDHALNPALRIASGPLQILIRVGEFVLIYSRRAFGEVELLRESFFPIPLCFRQEFCKTRNIRRQLGNFLFTLGEPFLNGLDFRSRRDRLRGGLVQRGRKREINFVVRFTKCVARQVLFLRRARQRRQRLRVMELLHVDRRLRGFRCRLGGRNRLRAPLGGQGQPRAGERQKQDQHNQKCALAWLHIALRCPT